MTDMLSAVAAIKAKYDSLPPADYPLYGDTVVFTDECNGRQYQGTVLRHHWMSPIGSLSRGIWVVRVVACLTTGEWSTEHGAPEWSVKQSEIDRIIRNS